MIELNCTRLGGKKRIVKDDGREYDCHDLPKFEIVTLSLHSLGPGSAYQMNGSRLA